MESTERRCFLNKIIENKANYKDVYKICNEFLGRNKDLPLPPYSSNFQLAKDFNKFFINRINKIRQYLNAIINKRADVETGKFSESGQLNLLKIQYF